MNYSYDEFSALAKEIDSQGGAHLPDECSPTQIDYSKDAGGPTNTCHCVNESMFVSPYEPTAYTNAKGARKRGAGLVRVCCVCDDLGKWPRYGKVME